MQIMFIYKGQKFAHRCRSIIFVLLTITGKKKKNAFKLLKNALRTKVSNKIKMNPFNNAEQDTNKLLLLFQAYFCGYAQGQ